MPRHLFMSKHQKIKQSHYNVFIMYLFIFLQENEFINLYECIYFIHRHRQTHSHFNNLC